MKLFDKISLSLSRLVNAAPIPSAPPYTWVQDTPSQTSAPQSSVPGTVQITPFVHVPAVATQFLKELSRTGFDLSKKVDIGNLLDMLPEEVFEPLAEGMPVRNVNDTHKDVFINWWMGTGQEDINQLNTSLQQHNIQAPDKDVSTIPVRRGPEVYPLDPSLYQKDWVPERDDPGYGKPLGWLEDFNKKSFIRVSLKKIASEFDNWLRNVWPTMAWLKVDTLNFDIISKIFNMLARHSPDQAKNVQQLLSGGEESFKRAISPLQSDIEDVSAPPKEETFEEKVIRQEQESLKNIDMQEQFMNRNKELVNQKKTVRDQAKRIEDSNKVVFQYRFIMLGHYLSRLQASTGYNVPSIDIYSMSNNFISYMMGAAANVVPGVAFVDRSGSGQYKLVSSTELDEALTQCFGAVEKAREIVEQKRKADPETLAFIKPRADMMNKMAEDLKSGAYPFMVDIRNQFSESSRPENMSLDNMKRFVMENQQLATNAEEFWNKSSKNFPAKFIDPDESGVGGGRYEKNQVKKLVLRWSDLAPYVAQFDFSSVPSATSKIDPAAPAMSNVLRPSQELEEPAVGEATVSDFDTYFDRNEPISERMKKKLFAPIKGFSDTDSIYDFILNSLGSMHGNELSTKYRVHAPSTYKEGKRGNIPIHIGTWLKNYGSDRGLEGVVVGVEDAYIAVFIPGQGYNKITGWVPNECEVSTSQVKPKNLG